MADEGTNDQTTDSTGSEFDLGSVLERAKAAGVNLITEDALQKRMGKERRQREELAAQMEALRAEHEEAAKRLQEYEGKNKSDEQRRAEEFARLEKQRDAYRQQVEDAQRLADERASRLRDVQLEQTLGGILGDRAVNLRHATVIARAELQGLSVNDDGQFVFTDPATEIDYTGDDAIARVKTWWDKQTHLHRAAPGGPPPANGDPPNGDKAKKWSEMSSEEIFASIHQ